MTTVDGDDMTDDDSDARERDELVLRVLSMAAQNWGVGCIGADAGLDVIEVIDLLYAHRDAFAPAFQH